jgi:hypothetical protein
LSTWLMFLWLLAAVVAIAVYRPACQGRKVAYLTVTSFVFLIIMLTAGLLMDSRHWGRGEKKNAECRMMNDELPRLASAIHHSSFILHHFRGGRPC